MDPLVLELNIVRVRCAWPGRHGGKERGEKTRIPVITPGDVE